MNTTMFNIVNETREAELPFLPREWLESPNNEQLVHCTIGGGAIGVIVPVGVGILLLALGRVIKLYWQYRKMSLYKPIKSEIMDKEPQLEQ